MKQLKRNKAAGWYWHQKRQRDQWNETGSPERNPSKCGNLFYGRDI